MLILWDIDGTLLITQKAGMAAMKAAGAELFTPAFTVEGVDYAGRLDPLIISDLLAINNVPSTAQNALKMRLGYVKHMEILLAEPGRTKLLPGVDRLLKDIATERSVTQGLLTGNWEETGRLKLESAGIDVELFKIRIWGDDSPYHPPKREYLPAVAIERCSEIHGRRIEPNLVTIIGDTPNDIQCAKAHGCRSLAVATGLFSVDELKGAGADMAVPDLSRTDEMYRWLLTV